MKRTFLIIILIVCVFSGTAYGQNTSPIDLILVLDTSSGMSSSYDNVNNYLTGPFLTEFLRVGDTFHLITFAERPRLDAARRISGLGDIETMIGRVLIQYPVEAGNNVGSALSFAEQYVTSLPNRAKKIVLVTLGEASAGNLVSGTKQRLSSSNTTVDFVQITPGQRLTNLPASGRPAARTASAATATIQSARNALTTPTAAQPARTTAASPPASQTTTPSTSATQPTAAASTAQSAASSTTATRPAAAPSTTQTTTQPAASAQPATTPSAAQTTQPAASAQSATAQSATQTTPAASAQPVTAAAAAPTETDALTASAAVSSAASAVAQEVLSEKTEEVSSEKTSSDESAASESKQMTAAAPKPAQEKQSQSSSFTSSLPFIIGIIILILLILGLIIFLLSRKLSSSPNRVITGSKKDVKNKTPASTASQQQRSTPYDNKPLKADNGKTTLINSDGPALLNLYVNDQNTSIGKRNIHSLKSGYSLSVGGSKSDDFYIFLVPVPPKLGEIRRDGSHLSFIPHKAKYFPDIGSNEVKDCINKTIRIVSDKNYEMRFRFELYEDPLLELNRLLHSVKLPG